jgi:hypothetical protein
MSQIKPWPIYSTFFLYNLLVIWSFLPFDVAYYEIPGAALDKQQTYEIRYSHDSDHEEYCLATAVVYTAFT